MPLADTLHSLSMNVKSEAKCFDKTVSSKRISREVLNFEDERHKDREGVVIVGQEERETRVQMNVQSPRGHGKERMHVRNKRVEKTISMNAHSSMNGY